MCVILIAIILRKRSFDVINYEKSHVTCTLLFILLLYKDEERPSTTNYPTQTIRNT